MATIVRSTDSELQGELRLYDKGNDEFTEPMPSLEWMGTKTDIGLIVLPNSDEDPELNLSFICLASKGRQISTRMAAAHFSYIRSIQPTLSINEWVNAVPSRYRGPLYSAIQFTGKEIPPGTWAEARKALVSLRPEAAGILSELEAAQGGRPQTVLAGHVREIMEEQKDAVGLALSIAGIGRLPIAQWEAPAAHAPFLEGIGTGPLGTAREDVLVIHDAGRVPGWVPTGEPYVGIREFSDRQGNVLTVMNINRHEVEEITGADLLYYRTGSASFILVQYKRMTRSRAGELEFRPDSDKNFAEELARMRRIESLVDHQKACDVKKREADLESTLAYRLHPHASWIKLCYPEAFSPTGADLVAGMYLPLDYYEDLIASPSTLGPRGGRVITYDRVKRWFNNTLFIQLMADGWIGSQTLQTEWLNKAVEDALVAKRSVIVAEEKERHGRRYRR